MSDSDGGRWYSAWVSRVRRYRVKTCCLLVPLRAGVIIIGCLNLLIALVLIVGVASESAWPLLAQVQTALFEDASKSVCVLPPAADLAFAVLLLCGLYRKDVVILRWYVYYGIIVITTSLIVYSILIAALSVLFIILIIANLVYQAYVIILVRSVIVEFQLSADQKSTTDIEAATLARREEKYRASRYHEVAIQAETEFLTAAGGDSIVTRSGPEDEQTHVETTSVSPSSVVTSTTHSSTISTTARTVPAAVTGPISTTSSTRPATPIASQATTAPVSTPSSSIPSSSSPSSSRIPPPVSSLPSSTTPTPPVTQSLPTASSSTPQDDQSTIATPAASDPTLPPVESDVTPQPPPKKAEKKRRRLWK